MFTNPMADQINNNPLGGTASAVMYLFSPRIFSDQAKRPFMYNFDGNFTQAAVDAVQYHAQHRDSSRIVAMVSNPQYTGSMMPTSHPDHMLSLRTISHQWTFMLVVNNDKTSPEGITRSMADNLQLYYGYFLDEPINPNFHMGRVTYNPTAQLVVTHKTIVNKTPWMGQYGQGSRLDTAANLDIIPTRSMGYMLDRPTTLIRPQELYGSVSVDMEGRPIVMHDDSTFLQNMEQSVDIQSKLSVPKTNIKKVLDAVATTHGSLVSGDLDGTVSLFSDGIYESLLAQNLQDGVANASINIGLPSNVLINMDFVVRRYNPELKPLPMEHQPQYAQKDQAAPTASNVFSSLLSSIVPPILTDLILAELTFSYNSYADAPTIHSYATLTPMAPQDAVERVHSALHRLRAEVFPILRAQRGEFDLNMSCDTSNATRVVLNFMDDTIRHADAFEVPTMLGGLNSPMIASADVATTNSGELGRLLNIMHEDDRDRAPRGFHDQQQFRRGLDSYDNNNPPLTMDWGI